MSKIVFSSWAGEVVDNRGLTTKKYASAGNVEFPLQYNGREIKALMSWNGMVAAADRVNIVGMASCYMKEVQKLSCGECNVGYMGIKVMTDVLDRISSGKGSEEDIELLRRLGNGIKGNTRCDFCALAVTPILDTLKYYEEEYTKAITNKRAVAKSDYVTTITAPCAAACPAHQDIPGYIELIRNRRYEEALELIRKTNCLPGVTGRACVAFCEAKCVRNEIDSPIAIRALKRVPADYEISRELEPKFEKKRGRGKVAVIGAGPAGLAASYNLALMGYKVTIYDEQSSAGGMALVGIPSYRLPKDILKREVNIIEELGIEVKPNTSLGKDITLEQLSSQGFKAIFIATGAHIDREPDIENWKKDYAGLLEGIEFLSSVNLGKKVAPKNRVIIVGGGNVAVDCARTCLRLGCKDVTIMYRRSEAEMPGRREEIEEAKREGTKFYFLAVPTKVLTKGNKVSGAECIRMELGEPDASGRRRPIPIKGSEFVIETDMIISATGEAPDLSFLTGEKQIKITEQGTIEVEPNKYQTGKVMVFAGGDCVIGPATLIEAIAAGNRAARSIDQYLQSSKVTLSEDDMVENWLQGVALNQRRDGNIVAGRPRQSPEQLAVPDRKSNFNEVELCLTPEAAARETERCLRCYRVMVLAVASRG